MSCFWLLHTSPRLQFYCSVLSLHVQDGYDTNIYSFDDFYVADLLSQEYKVSNFEQRLMSEIEFRLERTPVEESDDEVQHDDVPTGRCIAPIFDKKLKNFRTTEGVPVTLSCKVVGIPFPKVRSQQQWGTNGCMVFSLIPHIYPPHMPLIRFTGLRMASRSWGRKPITRR